MRLRGSIVSQLFDLNCKRDIRQVDAYGMWISACFVFEKKLEKQGEE